MYLVTKLFTYLFTYLVTYLQSYLLTYFINYLLSYLRTYLVSYLPTYSHSLTPCSVVLEKLTGFQLVKKFPTFYGTRRFINTFTSARHLSLS